MKTILKGKTSEVEINNEGPVVIIGESINPTRRKKLVETLSRDNFEFVLELAKIQVDAGAGVLDVNVGFPGVDDVRLLPATVKEIQKAFDVPLCLDSPNPAALEAALKVAEGKCLVNSVNGEEKSMAAVLPIVREYGAAVIGLVMDEEGITHDPEKRLAVADKILERAASMGINPEDVVIDPLAMAVSADPQACGVTLETIRLIREKLGLNMTEGTSNVSFGLPNREVLNNTFVTLSVFMGVSCPIANPVRIATAVKAANLMLGRDDFAMNWVEHYQQSQN